MRFIKFLLLLILFVALGATVAEECQTAVLYDGETKTQAGLNSGSTWPEPPEILTNWGEKDGLLPPYIRFSGQKNETNDWVGVLRFDTQPVVSGGDLSFKAHATKSVQLSVGAVFESGVIPLDMFSLQADNTVSIDLNLQEVELGLPSELLGIELKLNQVPAGEYVTVFFDDFSLTCVQNGASPPLDDGVNVHPGEFYADHYPFPEIDPVAPARFVDPEVYTPDYANVIKVDSVLNAQKEKSSTGIVLSLDESFQIIDALSRDPVDAEESTTLWKTTMHILARGRLKDSVFANPSLVWKQASFIAADANRTAVPLVMGDVEFEIDPCYDGENCEEDVFPAQRYMHVSLATSFVRGARIAVVYDPQFLVTNITGELPAIEINVGGQWKEVPVKGFIMVDLYQAGENRFQMRITRGDATVENVIKVEVR